MALSKLTTDLNNVQGLPNQPKSTNGYPATTIKELIDKAPNDIKTFINDILTTEIDLTFATKEEVAGIILGQIIDGALTDVKLSDEAGQIKERLATHLLAYAAFVATKGQANGFPSLDGDTLIPTAQIPNPVFKAGDLKISGDAGGATGSTTSYVKASYSRKTGASGTLRISFAMRAQGTITAYCEILRNGSPVGTTRSTTSTTNVVYTEDITGWSIGDELSFQTKVSIEGGSNYALVSEFYASVESAPILQ